MSLLRIYKNISVQSGPFNTTNRRVTFKEDLAENETIDHSKSYIIATVEPTGAVEYNGIPFTGNLALQPIHGYYFGNNYPDLGLNKNLILSRIVYDNIACKYAPSCLVQNSRLDSYTKGNLESNRNINFLKHSMRQYTDDEQMRQNMTWQGADYTKNEAVSPYVRTHFSDLKWTGDVYSTEGAANVIIPLKDLYMLGSEEMPYMLGQLTYQLELENDDQVLAEFHNFTGNDDWQNKVANPCDDIADTGDGAGRSIVTLTLPNNGRVKAGDNLVVRWRSGGVETVIKYVAGNQYVLAGDVITCNFDLFAANVAIDQLSVEVYNGGVVQIDAAILAGNDIELNPVDDKNDLPFYIGERVVLAYQADVAGVPTATELYRTVVSVNYDDETGVAVLTLDGPALPVQTAEGVSNAFMWTPLLRTQPTFSITEMQLVTWRLNYGNNEVFNQLKNQPMLYDKLVVEPFNRLSNNKFQKVYELPVGTRKYLFLNKLTTLISNDRNLAAWRTYLDQIPTVDRDVDNGQPLHKDKLIKFLLNDLRSLDKNPIPTNVGYIGTSMLADINQSGNPAPMLDIRQYSRTEVTQDNDPGFLLDASLLYLYSWTMATINF